MPREKQNEGITLLGNNNTKYPQTYDPSVLETFEIGRAHV